MAYTREEYENLLKEIANSGGDTPAMMELLQKLRDDYDEREGLLKRYGEERDKRAPEGSEEERDKIRKESEEDNIEDKGERRIAYDDYVPREDYEELRKKYIERFFTSPDKAKRMQKENVMDDGKKRSFEELFKEREG